MKRQEIRSEETRKDILEAAGKLFATKGYNAVTMREIAKEAGLSHTTIYIYFKDKVALLQKLTIPYLILLEENFKKLMETQNLTALEKLKMISEEFLMFALKNKGMYHVFFMIKASRVDDAVPDLEVNTYRNKLFAYMKDALMINISEERRNAGLEYARIFFYTLDGMIHTYQDSEESIEQLLERLKPILQTAVEILIAGINHRKEEGK